jgi:tetratricopeptide (TPR) repeat protein
VLGDGNDSPAFIETVPRAGYRFISPVTPAGAATNGAPASPMRQAEVYEHVGRGRVYLLTASRALVPAAVKEFAAAVELDPTYADAHAGLALANCARAELRLANSGDAYREAKSAALRALALDDQSADAQLALATVLFLSEWDWTGAERSLQRALELDPHRPETYLLYGRLLEALGRLDAGLQMKWRALEHDPLSSAVHLSIAASYWNQRRYEDAIVWANKTLAIDPKHLLAREFLAGAYWALHDFDRHMAANLAHAEAYGVTAEALEPLKQAYTAGGRQAVIALSLSHAKAAAGAMPDAQLALLYGESGDLDNAFRHLDRAIETHDPCLVHLGIAPQWDSLRGDARFASRLTRVGIPA